MVDSLQIGAAIVVIFVFALTTEILFAFCRVFGWLKRQVGPAGRKPAPPDRYTQPSVSHSWSETTTSSSTNSVKLSNASSDELMPTTDDHHYDNHQDANDIVTVSEATHLSASPSADHSETLQVYDRTERKRSPGLRHHGVLQSTDFTQSMQRDWRLGEFGCGRCGKSLTGQRYIMREEQPYCKHCYDAQFANACTACGTPITTDYKDLSYKDVHWHDKCFKCSSCGVTLVNESFAFKNNRLHCATCYEQMFAPRCVRCSHVFRAGMKKYEHRGRQWHADCFVCKVCQTPIGTNSFIPRGNDVICVQCYGQYSEYCPKCSRNVGKGGIVFNNSSWHRECLLCFNCDRVLGRERFTAVQDKPCCVQCYSQLYANKCAVCDRAITGVDGARFIAFEGRHWHANCFACYKCRVALFGRAFLTDGGDILCPDCCKEE